MPWFDFGFFAFLKRLFHAFLKMLGMEPQQVPESSQNKAVPRTSVTALEMEPSKPWLPEMDFGYMDAQAGSPLFMSLPAEIRNHIFQLALTSFDDKTRPYKRGAYYYRPGHRYAQKIDTNLLRTCRRILYETRDIPASINEVRLREKSSPLIV